MKDNVKKSNDKPEKVLKNAEQSYGKKAKSEEGKKEIAFFSSVLADLDRRRRKRAILFRKLNLNLI